MIKGARDGKAFRMFLKEFKESKHNFGVALTADGIQRSSVSVKSFWPVMVRLETLPVCMRYKVKNMHVAMLLPSSMRNMDLFLTPLVDELCCLRGGVTMEIKRSKPMRDITADVRGGIVTVSGDLRAIPKMMRKVRDPALRGACLKCDLVGTRWHNRTVYVTSANPTLTYWQNHHCAVRHNGGMNNDEDDESEADSVDGSDDASSLTDEADVGASAGDIHGTFKTMPLLIAALPYLKTEECFFACFAHIIPNVMKDLSALCWNAGTKKTVDGCMDHSPGFVSTVGKPPWEINKTAASKWDETLLNARSPCIIKSPFHNSSSSRKSRNGRGQRPRARRRLLEQAQDPNRHVMNEGVRDMIDYSRRDRKLAHWLHMLYDGRYAFSIATCWRTEVKANRNDERLASLLDLVEYMSDTMGRSFSVEELHDLEARGKTTLAKFYKCFPRFMGSMCVHMLQHAPHAIRCGGPLLSTWTLWGERLARHVRNSAPAEHRTLTSMSNAYSKWRNKQTPALQGPVPMFTFNGHWKECVDFSLEDRVDVLNMLLLDGIVLDDDTMAALRRCEQLIEADEDEDSDISVPDEEEELLGKFLVGNSVTVMGKLIKTRASHDEKEAKRWHCYVDVIHAERSWVGEVKQMVQWIPRAVLMSEERERGGNHNENGEGDEKSIGLQKNARCFVAFRVSCFRTQEMKSHNGIPRRDFFPSIVDLRRYNSEVDRGKGSWYSSSSVAKSDVILVPTRNRHGFINKHVHYAFCSQIPESVLNFL